MEISNEVKQTGVSADSAAQTRQARPAPDKAAGAEAAAARPEAEALSQRERLTDLLRTFGLKAVDKNFEILTLLLENGMPLTKENFARLNQALKLTENAEQALFLLQNGIRLTRANAEQLSGLAEGRVRITEMLNNLLAAVSELPDAGLRNALLRMFAQVENAVSQPQTAPEAQNNPPAQTPPGTTNEPAAQPGQPQTLQTPQSQTLPPQTTQPLTAQSETPQPPGQTAAQTAVQANAQEAAAQPALNQPPQSPTQTAPQSPAQANAQETTTQPALNQPPQPPAQATAQEAAAQPLAQTAPQPQPTAPPAAESAATAQPAPPSGQPINETIQRENIEQPIHQPDKAAPEQTPARQRAAGAHAIPPEEEIAKAAIQARQTPPARETPRAARPMLAFKLQDSAPEDIDRFFNSLRDVLFRARETVEAAKNPENEAALRQMRALSEHIDFVAQIKNQLFVQLPVFHNGQETNTALHIYKDARPEKKNKTGAASALIALDTAFLGHFETYVQKLGQSVTCQFRLPDQHTEKLVRSHIHELEKLLLEYRYRLDSFSFLPQGEPYTLLDSPEERGGKAPDVPADIPAVFDKRA